jgi:hypothetical protein
MGQSITPSADKNFNPKTPMAKFIKITNPTNGTAFYVNPDHIIFYSAATNGKGTAIVTTEVINGTSQYMDAKESVNDVTTMIAGAKN